MAGVFADYQVCATYRVSKPIYLLKAMKFLLLSITLTTLLGPLVVPPRPASTPASDEAAIQTVIERETQAYLDRDATTQANCWASTGDLSQRVGLDDGQVVAANGNQAALRRGLSNCFRQLTEPDPATFRHTDYRIRIRGDAAFVTFRQIMQYADRPTEYSHQTRYLEREAEPVQAGPVQAGQWKIVHSGVLYYQPKPDQLVNNQTTPKP